MDVKINVCEKTEWDPNFLDRIPMTDGELKEIEAKLIDDLDVTDDYSLFLYGQFLYEKVTRGLAVTMHVRSSLKIK